MFGKFLFKVRFVVKFLAAAISVITKVCDILEEAVKNNSNQTATA